MTHIDQIDKKRLPRHVAIIMDGNGRWAKQHGHDRVFGHQNGVDSVDKVTEAAAELGIEYLTLYAFSTENLNRPKAEVDALMEILSSALRFMIEKNAVYGKHTIGLTIFSDHPIAIWFCNCIWAIWMEWCILVLGTLFNLSI